ncbi:MAG: sigma-54-dependent Fis family transcriptional regulator [bacterium]|nr:sigma-54-dependent Fis family transcriptional regulator [bacterium]
MSVVQGQILIVDDEPNIRLMLAGVLEDEGYAVNSAGDVAAARAVLEEERIDLMLLDVKLPDVDGISFLRELRDGDAPPIIMMSGHGTVTMAMEAVQLGALDFVEKPIKPERLLVSVQNGVRLRRLAAENIDLKQALAITGEMIGSGEIMTGLREEIARTAPTDARVLITGENGTGKELVARALHAASRRSEQPFVKINCAAIPSELLESELFGHEKGAFTGALNRRRGKFELAQNGTILLDEIGDMNPTTQAKLLRVLEEGEMERVGSETAIKLDVRVFASTNQDLDRLMMEGEFRRDLYHRIKVVPIHIPPLRERRSDIDELVAHYLAHFCAANGRRCRQLDKGALGLLNRYSWPGNVRELKNMMERVVIMTDDDSVPATVISKMTGDAGSDDPRETGSLAERLAAHELRIVKGAMASADGNKAAAARELGLDPANLHRRMQRLGLKG